MLAHLSRHRLFRRGTDAWNRVRIAACSNSKRRPAEPSSQPVGRSKHPAPRDDPPLQPPLAWKLNEHDAEENDEDSRPRKREHGKPREDHHPSKHDSTDDHDLPRGGRITKLASQRDFLAAEVVRRQADDGHRRDHHRRQRQRGEPDDGTMVGVQPGEHWSSGGRVRASRCVQPRAIACSMCIHSSTGCRRRRPMLAIVNWPAERTRPSSDHASGTATGAPARARAE